MNLHTPRSLSNLNHIHYELDGLFKKHQRALLEKKYMEAYSLFRLFEEGLLAHKCEEEDILFPLFRKRARGRWIADLDNLTEEHQNAVEWLTCLKTGLYRLTSLTDPMEVVVLLDNEARFKLFMNQHMIREERSFYPALEKLTSETEKASLCRLLTFSLDSFADETNPGSNGRVDP